MKREPEGIPVGGQFATDRKAESGVALPEVWEFNSRRSLADGPLAGSRALEGADFKRQGDGSLSILLDQKSWSRSSRRMSRTGFIMTPGGVVVCAGGDRLDGLDEWTALCHVSRGTRAHPEDVKALVYDALRSSMPSKD